MRKYAFHCPLLVFQVQFWYNCCPWTTTTTRARVTSSAMPMRDSLCSQSNHCKLAIQLWLAPHRWRRRRWSKMTVNYWMMVERYPNLKEEEQHSHTKVRETFELNQLKSVPSQLLPVFSRFDRLQTCCHSFGPANILFFFFFFKYWLISSSL